MPRPQAIGAGASCSNSYAVRSVVYDARRKGTVSIRAVRACVVTREHHAARLENNCVTHVTGFWLLDDALVPSVSSPLNNSLYLGLQRSLGTRYLAFNLSSVYFLVRFLDEYHPSSGFSWKNRQETTDQALRADKSFFFSFLGGDPCVAVESMKPRRADRVFGLEAETGVLVLKETFLFGVSPILSCTKLA